MNALSSLVSKIGQNSTFIAFMAHSGFAYFVVSLFSGMHQYVAAVVCFIVFAIKEFFYDIKFEQNPPQTFMDSSDDFTGYLIGIIVSLAIRHFVL